MKKKNFVVDSDDEDIDSANIKEGPTEHENSSKDGLESDFTSVTNSDLSKFHCVEDDGVRAEEHDDRGDVEGRPSSSGNHPLDPLIDGVDVSINVHVNAATTSSSNTLGIATDDGAVVTGGLDLTDDDEESFPPTQPIEHNQPIKSSQLSKGCKLTYRSGATFHSISAGSEAVIFY